LRRSPKASSRLSASLNLRPHDAGDNERQEPLRRVNVGLRVRILRLVHPDGGGPRSRRILEAMARTPREQDHAADTVTEMIRCGALVRYGDKRGAKYGLPRVRW